MKQKLLNSFTWRGTLLVALLSCAFSAWAEGSTTLTFSGSSTSVSVDDVTWGISGGNFSSNSWSISKNNSATFTITSSIKGKITKVVVNAKSAQNNKGHVGVKVNGNNLGNTATYTLSNSDANYTFQQNSGVDVDGTRKIVVTGSAENKTIYINSITVYYDSDPKFSISDACHGIADEEGNVRNFGTYSYEYPFKVPAATIGENGNNDLKVFTINVEGDALHLNQLSEGTIVPANTGVLVSATAGGTYDAVLTLASGEALDNNMLVASSVAMSGNNLFYHLTMNGDDIGFYWGAANGVAWTFSGTNKAYLAIPSSNSNSIKGFSFTDTTNGIKTVEATESESSVIYNLAGQRVSKMQKGIYVVNGKKMLVK